MRIRSAASSDGQEPYSIALTVFQAFPNVLDYDFKILATDIDPKILAIARQGAYDEQALETVSPAIRKQWFKEVEINGRRKFQVDDRLKRLITYNELNLMAQWPFKGKFDVIFCRNVVIYFDEPTQMRIWTRFADLLPVGGHLYIGHSERVSGDSKNDFDNIGSTVCHGRHHDHRHGPELHNLFQEFQAVHVRHLDVERHDIGIELLDRRASLHGVSGLADDADIGILAEHGRDQTTHGRAVVDDENACRC